MSKYLCEEVVGQNRKSFYHVWDEVVDEHSISFHTDKYVIDKNGYCHLYMPKKEMIVKFSRRCIDDGTIKLYEVSEEEYDNYLIECAEQIKKTGYVF